jgi:hypothetical protein
LKIRENQDLDAFFDNEFIILSPSSRFNISCYDPFLKTNFTSTLMAMEFQDPGYPGSADSVDQSFPVIESGKPVPGKLFGKVPYSR